jgi:hypothetical protein
MPRPLLLAARNSRPQQKSILLYNLAHSPRMQDNQTHEARAADLIRAHGAQAGDAVLTRFNDLMNVGDDASALDLFKVLEAVWDLEDGIAPPTNPPK